MATIQVTNNSLIYESVYSSEPPVCECGQTELSTLFGLIPTNLVGSELEESSTKFDDLNLNAYCRCKIQHNFKAVKRDNLVSFILLD
jgi:hypothetical protein